LLNLQAAEKDWAATEQTLSRARAAGADSAASDLVEGRLHQARGESDRARASFERALARQPDAPEPLIALVQLDLQQGKAQQAREWLEQALARNPNHLYASGFLGEVALLGGDQAGAERRFHEATERKPDWVQPWLHLATLKLSQKKRDEAQEILEQGVRRNPNSQELRLLLATTLGEAGNVDRAIQEYDALLGLNPRALVAANNLASLLADKKGDPKSLERALALSREFESKQPNPYFLDTLGWVHLKLGHGQGAVRLLKQATALAPDHPVLNYHLGAAYLKSGQPVDARVHLQKAVAAGKPFEGMDAAKALLAEVAG
jgi:predicted Zn-dependent protease